MAEKQQTSILLTAFGTSTEEGKRAYRAIDTVVREAFPEAPIYWAFTSGTIRRKLQAKGERLDSVAEALSRMTAEGISRVAVQSLHVAAGEEFDKMKAEIQLFLNASPALFSGLSIGRPLLESCQDLNEAVDAVLKALPAERKSEDAVLLMGHGQEAGRCDLIFAALAAALSARDPRMFLATVEGGIRLADVMGGLQKSGARRVCLCPFLIVAGDHAMNDLAGDEPGSWKSQLTREGFACYPHLKGLGEIPEIARIFVRHIRQSIAECHS